MKVLQITSELNGGGVDRLLYDYCSRMIPDIQFDFIVTAEKKGILEQPLKDLGCNIYRVSQFRKSINEHKKQIRDIIERGNYDIIHDHSGYKAFVNLKIAKKCGIKTRIAHAHQAFVAESFKSKMLRVFVTPLTKYYATNLFACGIDAGRWMWGYKTFNSGKVHIMTNAINIPKFTFSEKTRSEMRKQLGIEGKFVVGNVARFSYQKNHEFLLDIFMEIKHRNDNAVLLLIGGGELEDDIKAKVSEYSLNDSVLFLGVRNDVHKLLSAMDAFVLPSRFEGLPVTLVEAQAASLPSYAADTITKEIGITNYLTYIPLNKNSEYWAQMILSAVSMPRRDLSKIIEDRNYDIKTEAEKMKQIYFSLKSCC